jgi:hypothetical protein
VKTAPQNTIEPGASTEIINELFISPYVEKESLKKL